MKVPESFDKLGGGLHQDVGLCATEGLVAYCLGFLTASERTEIEPFLRNVLASSTGAEIKGLLNRTPAARRFSAKEARALLEDLLAELESRKT
ncbi:hypothetical protein ASD89_23470 [Caulobacter sp. Root656]|nr:hypothetical protein ASD89_23470 [Caulobacter sp. Root656]